jgi:RNA binding exosome subunit
MIHNLSYRAFVYGTESEEKVREALKTLLPSVVPEKEITEGHHKNQVLILQGKTSKNTEIKMFLEKLRNLSLHDKKMILKGLEDRMDSRGNLFLRFGKQSAYLGDLKLVAHGDTLHIKMKIAAYPAKKEEALKVARQLFGE